MSLSVEEITSLLSNDPLFKTLIEYEKRLLMLLNSEEYKNFELGYTSDIRKLILDTSDDICKVRQLYKKILIAQKRLSILK